MKNKILLVTAIACLSMNAANAALAIPAPNHCPSVASLQTAPLTLGQIDFQTNTYVTAAFGNAYDTNVNWTLIVGNIAANGAPDAIKKATADIPNFVLDSNTPQQFFDAWLCGYQSDLGYQVLAVTSTSATSAQSLSALLAKMKA